MSSQRQWTLWDTDNSITWTSAWCGCLADHFLIVILSYLCTRVFICLHAYASCMGMYARIIYMCVRTFARTRQAIYMWVMLIATSTSIMISQLSVHRQEEACGVQGKIAKNAGKSWQKRENQRFTTRRSDSGDVAIFGRQNRSALAACKYLSYASTYMEWRR